MCGIAGVQVRSGTRPEKRALDALSVQLGHRGPDANGLFCEKNTALVCTRLAIMDVAHGDQPLCADGGAVLVANGEIYNSPELRANYAGYPFKTNSDCEVILPIFEEWDTDFAEHLRGMYAIALYDRCTERLVLSRDPFGIKPLYLVQTEEYCAFASEMAPLFNLGFAPRETDPVAESELLQLKYVIGSKTIVPTIRRIQPGHTVVIENGRVVEERIISTWPPKVPSAARSAGRKHSREVLLEEFSRIIEDSVSVHLRSDVPWCLLYSGGIDSTILMRVAQKVCSAPFRAFSIGYAGDHPEDESQNAVRLAALAGVTCDRIEMGETDFWMLAPRIVAALGDPIADPAVLPLYVLASAVRGAGYKVAVSGEGADELFAGYSRYRRATLPNFLRVGRSRRGVFSHREMATQHFEGWDKEIDEIERAQAGQWSSNMQMLQARDVLERLPNCLLVKLDRALMAHGVEGRTPFLDKRVVEFALNVPDRLKAGFRLGKRLLRDWLACEFPESTPYARKKGFDLPIGDWIHPRRQELAHLLTLQPALARLFMCSEIRAVLDDCLRNEQAAWSLIQFALWHAHHMQGVACDGDVFSVLTQSGERKLKQVPRSGMSARHDDTEIPVMGAI